MRKIYWLIAGTALTMILLICFQWFWFNKSKELIEEQFNNKVSMALCAAVEKISADPGSCQMAKSSCATSPTGCNETLQAMIKDSTFTEVIKSSLAFYQINIPYQAKLAVLDTAVLVAPQYSCSLSPILAQDDHWLQIIFQGKKDYFHQKIKFTLFTSILIVLLILSLFIYATRSLIKQQTISEDNRHFFNHMTHEFSTPLTNLQLAAKMIKKNPSPEKLKTYLHIIDQQSLQLKSQIEHVLQMATVEKDSFQLNKESLDLQTLAQDAVASMSLQIQEKQAIVNINPSPEHCQIQGDKMHVHNVFRNLIDNALKYCHEIPKIEIAFYPDQHGCGAQVSDNGYGIDPNDQDKIFKNFYRGSSVQEGSDRGFGIGLAYVKKILNLHQGDIRIASDPSAKGTCFELYFPK